MAKAPFLYFTTYAEQGRIMKYEEAGGRDTAEAPASRENVRRLGALIPGEHPVAAWARCSVAGRVAAAWVHRSVAGRAAAVWARCSFEERAAAAWVHRSVAGRAAAAWAHRSFEVRVAAA
ncbi:hypothetical protein [Paenibacillus thiaminolyticus]|uniref:Uncharacterized protein n=1 Tax=Paenibacillus thiaminolyticus TaxID=49283 RepID=A0A3A3GRI7_PANTH|nr:hypothetical protein [Paenibacillus thiaminolyticus]RJG26128.1 hypothetical protein DQX05_04360 [Paenibacillus thiaminolyticus]